MDDRQSVTGVHRFPSARMALAAQATRIADMLERMTSSAPPPPSDPEPETLDVEPDPDPTPLAA